MTLTTTEIWDRLVEAADTLRRLPDPRRGPQGPRTSWPDIVRATSESFNVSAERAALLRRTPPTPDAIDRLEESLRWIGWIEGDLQKLVWLRANGVPWWRLELRLWRLRGERRRYERTTLLAHVQRGLKQIAARLAASSMTKGYPQVSQAQVVAE